MNPPVPASLRTPTRSFFQAVGVLLACTGSLAPAAPKPPPAAISLSTNGLIYLADKQGNRVPDFSYCGYAKGERPIPDAPVRVAVAPAAGDGTQIIQRAINYVSGLPTDTNGLRGAVLLLKGRHQVSGTLHLRASGVVLRGQGMGEDGTVLVATGLDRRTLIRIAGKDDRAPIPDNSWTVKDDYVPVGALQFHVGDAGALKPGDTVTVTRPCTQPWIDRLGMRSFGGQDGDWRLVWKPGSRDVAWDRVVLANTNGLVTLDAPLTTALEREFGGGRVEAYHWPGRLSNVGVENLLCESTFDLTNAKDENHSWFAITMENVQDAWVRQVTATHFAGSLAAIYETCRSVTVEDCLSLAPVSEEGGYRRHTFFTMGQLTLFLRCHAEHGRHDFSVGHCAPGPNAFVQCNATLPLADSGPIESWASGVLYDCVTIDGNGLSLGNRGPNPHGAGWAAANSVLWQCSASVVVCVNPPTARNWAFGCWGEFEGDGVWRNANESVRPYSLYVAQVADRLGPGAASRIRLLQRSTDESSNPSPDQAAQLISASLKPAPLLADYIRSASTRNPIPCNPAGARKVEELGARLTDNQAGSGQGSRKTISITNGWLICDGRLLLGRRLRVPWWQGNIRPAEAARAEPDVTRFVPGRTGPGFTDDLTEVADSLQEDGVVALDHNYGLWYDRRRDDHERVRRITGDVWPPFYEMPFARSGQGTAWNGLSLYDLTRYNPWYWSRLQEFAGLCDQRGLVLFHQNYFQHNILEAGAHWADSPWRSTNNLNNTGFPEPPPYAGDKRIFMAEQFYDVTHPGRRALHRAYIRQCLENFTNASNVVQFTSSENSGPLHFVQFWLDTIGEWARESGRHPTIALACPKDVQDAILADPDRNRLVDLVCFRYWWQTDGGLYAPKGGQNLSPRQLWRLARPQGPSDSNLASMAADYRSRYPDKAVIAQGEETPLSRASWAFLCAGGSMPNIPAMTDPHLLSSIPRMQLWSQASARNRWVLREPGRQFLVYTGPGASPTLDLSTETGSFSVHSVDTATGKLTALSQPLTASAETRLPASTRGSSVLWLTRDESSK